MTDLTETEARAREDAASSALMKFEPEATGQFAVVPAGWSIADLERYQELPNRHRGAFSFTETASLAEYVNRFGTEATQIAASYDDAEITAVIDGHTPEAAGWGEHVAAYKARLHDKLKAWLDISEKPMGQVAFGLFLESRAVDVVQPDAASVMDMVMTFDATKKVTFKSQQRLHDGSRQFTYAEDTQATGAVTLPDRFVILTPVYRGMEPQRITFLLRYRIDEGKLRFQVEMHDKREVLAQAFERCIDAFRTGLTTDRFIYVTG